MTRAPAGSVAFWVGLLTTAGLAGACRSEAGGGAGIPGLVVLGVDGMDPMLARQYLAEGRLPNLAALAAEGGFVELETSTPPQSPVAWSDFITGRASDAHGIYDFVHRDPVAMAPYLSTSRVDEADHAVKLSGWRIPLGSAEMTLLRDGEPFWERLAARGIPATVLKIPAHFPPSPGGDAETLAGMGTPDLLGTYGTYQVFTDDPALVARALTGGITHRLVVVGGRAMGVLEGPPDPFRVSKAPLTVPLAILSNRARTAAVVRVGGEELLLRSGEWSGWVPVAFDPGPLAPSLSGMVRVLLKSLSPHVVLYLSPVNIDPSAPVMPISWPRGLSEELAADVGRFYTQGMPEDTKALESGVLTEEEFLAQVDLVFDEELAILRRQLRRHQGGFLFHYFSVVDQVSHVFFRALDPEASDQDRRHAEVLPRLYARIDRIVGEVRQVLRPDTPLIVMSDHGFSPYRFKVNLNTWLMKRGYLAMRKEPRSGALGHIDWARTQVYALGLNQLFVNLRGREAEGVVPPDERAILVSRIARELESFIDPVSGARVVSRVFRPATGRHPDRTPDLLVGFARGFRSSDLSATGVPESDTVTRNQDKWSGDHCMDPALVPGVLFSNRKLRRGRVSLVDLAPTVLGFFDVPPSEGAAGTSVFDGPSPPPGPGRKQGS